MNLKNCFLILLIMAVATSKISAQGEIPVNMYAGSPGIYIPLYTITDHDLSEPVSLVYNVNDVSLNGAHTYGVGWDLSSSNQMISREVRGLPDDFETSPETRKGWLYNTNNYSILSFPNSSDLSTATCTDEQSDNTYLNNLGYLVDTEPDLFSFSAGGMSGHFVFNNTNGTPTISLIPWQDIQIVPTFQSSPTNMTITGWTITTNSGVVYTFSQNSTVSRTLKKASTPTNQNMLTLFEKDYQLYKQLVSYSSSWMLTSTTSPTGAQITYSYIGTSGTTVTQRNAEILDAININLNHWYGSFSLMTDSVITTSYKLSAISTSAGMWATCDPIDGIRFYDPNRFPTCFKRFALGYGGGFLMSVTESGLGSSLWMPPYKLYYTNLAAYPISGSTSQDFWGFYNGANNQTGTVQNSFPTIYAYPSETGADRYRLYPSTTSGTAIVLAGNAIRTPDPNAILTGTLSRLVYPAGGETDLVFEANTYYDAKASKDQLAGGLRIKFVTYFDGVNPSANIIKGFTYVDASGHSSGSLITRPSFALPVWQYTTPATSDGYAGTTITYDPNAPASTRWRQTTAVTGEDIRPAEYTGGSIVGYSRVTVTRAGSGYVTFDYLVPAVYGGASTGSNPTDWIPTTMKFARPSSCPAMNIIGAGETWGYPSFPNPFYDYERGLLQKKTEYNNSGTKVRLTQNTYQYLFKLGSSSPSTVVGVAYERFANSTVPIFFYGRYTLLADVAKVVASETVTTYNESDTTRQAAVNTQYNYASAYHRLLSKINTTTADGTTYGTALKYTLDYPVTTQPSDSTLSMIYLLKSANRTGTLIEQVSTVKPSGGTEKTTGATLFQFRPFGFNKPLLRTTWASRPLVPVTTFSSSGVSGSIFVQDSSYHVVHAVNEYTTYDIPLSSTGENRITTGALWGYNRRVPIAKISQARTSDISFSDFETTTGSEFVVLNGFYGTGRTGTYAIHPSATLTRTMTKPAGATNYLLSFWLKNSSAGNITLQVVIKDGAGTVKSTNNYTYATGTSYQYFTQVVSISTVTTTTFTIQVQGQSLAQPPGTATTVGAGSYYTLQPSLLPMLDDIGFYPDYAAISSVTYDLPFGVNSSTSPAGNTAYTSYDGLGRTYMMSDQDLNARQRYTYNLTGQLSLSTLGATLCATGVQTVVNGVVTSSYSCAGVTANTNWVTFHVNSVTNLNSASLTYHWKYRNIGATTWSDVGGLNSDTYSTAVNIGTGVSFEAMCTIYASDGRIAETYPMSVTITGGS